MKEPVEEQDISEWINFDAETPENCIFPNLLLYILKFQNFIYLISDYFIISPAPNLLPQEDEEFKFYAQPHAMNFHEANPYHFTETLQQDQIGVPLQAAPSSTISQKQKFTLHEISPDWGYANETTKVSFLNIYRKRKFVNYIFLYKNSFKSHGIFKFQFSSQFPHV